MTQRITVYTLVDITETGIQRVRDSNTFPYHQQQNLNVLLQTIGLRTQALEPHVAILHESNLTDFKFDVGYSPPATVWSLTFNVEREAIWSDGIDDLRFLKDDINGVAVSSDLDNTVDFPINIFDTKNKVNTYIISS